MLYPAELRGRLEGRSIAYSGATCSRALKQRPADQEGKQADGAYSGQPQGDEPEQAAGQRALRLARHQW